MTGHRAAESNAQLELFETAEFASPRTPSLPEGWLYRAEFISEAQERELLVRLAAMPLHEARYKAYTARRRIAHFGTAYDFEHNRLLPAPPLPEALTELRGQAAAWIGIAADDFSTALVTEYRPGTSLGWHRDVPDFELVVGVSLAGACRMRMRRYPPVNPKKAGVLSVELAPRSAYVLRGPARWDWQHGIAPTPTLRYSVTFRTRVAAPCREDIEWH